MAKTYTPAAFCSINRKKTVNKIYSPDGGVRNFCSLSPICQKRRRILFNPARAAPKRLFLRQNTVLRKFVHIRNSAKNQTDRPVYPWFLCKNLVKVIVSKAVHAKSRWSRAPPAGGCVSPRDSPSTSRAPPDAWRRASSWRRCWPPASRFISTGKTHKTAYGLYKRKDGGPMSITEKISHAAERSTATSRA